MWIRRSCCRWPCARPARSPGRALRAEAPARDRRARWQAYLDAAQTEPPSLFNPNGYGVTALQAARASIYATRHIDGPARAPTALQLAVSIGNDTGTVAAGGLLGVRYSASVLPRKWVDDVHGWPGMRAADLDRVLGARDRGNPCGLNPPRRHRRRTIDGCLVSGRSATHR